MCANLEDSSRSADDDVARAQPARLVMDVFASNDQSSGEIMVFPNFSQRLEYLVGQLAGRRDDESA